MLGACLAAGSKLSTTSQVQIDRRTPTDIVSYIATRARGRSLSSRRWATRGLGAVLGIGRIAHEHPLAHGICSQLLRVLYLAELNGIDGHAVTEAEEG